MKTLSPGLNLNIKKYKSQRRDEKKTEKWTENKSILMFNQ